MSSTLARLRKLFDYPLLFRDGRKMIATPLAESLAKQIRDVLDQIESILADRTDFDPARTQRMLTIIASDVLSVILMDPGVHGEPEGELHATLHARDSERVGGAGRVRPGQQPRTCRVSGPRPGLFGNAASAWSSTAMWSAAVFEPAFPNRSSPARASPPRDVGTVQEAQQRMEPEGLLPGGSRPLLV